ncbi:MAG: hypothetical protein ABII74_07175 [Elusimicrobiota bacterium]
MRKHQSLFHMIFLVTVFAIIPQISLGAEQGSAPFFIYHPLTRQLLADVCADADFEARDEKNQLIHQKNQEVKNLFIYGLQQLLANRNLYLLSEALKSVEKISSFVTCRWQREAPFKQIFPRMEALVSSRSERRPGLEKISAGLKVSLLLLLLILAGLSSLSRFLLPPSSCSFQTLPLRL